MKKRVPLITLVAICLTAGIAAADEKGIDFFENTRRFERLRIRRDRTT